MHRPQNSDSLEGSTAAAPTPCGCPHPAACCRARITGCSPVGHAQQSSAHCDTQQATAAWHIGSHEPPELGQLGRLPLDMAPQVRLHPGQRQIQHAPPLVAAQHDLSRRRRNTRAALLLQHRAQEAHSAVATPRPPPSASQPRPRAASGLPPAAQRAPPRPPQRRPQPVPGCRGRPA